MLAVFDVLILNTALLTALVLRYEYRFSVATVVEAPIYFLLLTILWLAWASFFDCYDLPSTARASQGAWSTARAALLTALVYLAIPFYTPHFPTSRASAYLFVGLATLSVPAWRMFYATVFSQPTFRQRLVIVGAGVSGSELARELAHTPRNGNPHAGSGYEIVGFVDDDPAKAGAEVEGVPVLGNRYDLYRLVPEHAVDTVVVAITHTPTIHPELFQTLLDCQEQGIHLEPMTSLYERLTGRVPVEHAGRNLHVILPPSEPAMRRVFWAGKRLLDLVASVAGLVALGLIVPWVALANAVWSPGPLFYRQVRVGKGGKLFQLVKFRSMIPEAEEDCGAVWASEGDERATPVGRFLRRTRLDELPQVWDILRGEMSLVGPRPERPEFIREFQQQIPAYILRQKVKSGLTGLAQVRGWRGATSLEKRVECDIQYIEGWSLGLDLKILWLTLWKGFVNKAEQ
jgi:exopolysaccharide biosynthesis polyprenyl glycosylphosphotransferase